MVVCTSLVILLHICLFYGNYGCRFVSINIVFVLILHFFLFLCGLRQENSGNSACILTFHRYEEEINRRTTAENEFVVLKKVSHGHSEVIA